MSKVVQPLGKRASRMANIRQYFDSDFKGFFWYEGPFEIRVNDQALDPPVMYRILHHADSRASCVAFCVPANAVRQEICKLILDYRDWWLNIRSGLKIFSGFAGEPITDEISDTVFTGRVVLYIDGRLPETDVTVRFPPNLVQS